MQRDELVAPHGLAFFSLGLHSARTLLCSTAKLIAVERRGHSRQIDAPATLTACPLLSDRSQICGARRNVAECQELTHAAQQTT
jgi:hypothetical protein